MILFPNKSKIYRNIMRKIRPCFPGISLQRGVQAVAVIDILCSVIFEILTLVALVQCIKDEETCSFTPPANSYETSVAMLGCGKNFGK